ncbi:MAG: DUF2169 domain-containing protein [Deltaproteobacteria bacterium]|nr:DUF2169 domain-containing protein [Deltaproteobacteria bacterium]
MPFELGTLLYPLRPPEVSMVVVAKGTFDLQHGATAKVARPQRPLSGDTFFDDEADASPVYPSDFALLKERGECFVLGSCRPAGGRATVSAVAFQVGSVQKAMGVFGNRRWKRGLLLSSPTDPEPFEVMPLRWDLAYGGPGVAANPVGRGVAERIDAEGKRHRPLPNLESTLHPIGGPDDAPEPVGFGPIAAHWSPRRKLAGTYDDRWAKTRAPYLPFDIHPSFFNQAPLDQRVRSHWAGNEEIVLKNVSPDRALLRSRLPGLRVRAFVEGTPKAGGQLRELKMTLDTIVVDGDAGQALCVWRGVTKVADEHASDVARLFAFHEPFDAQTSFDACRDRLNANLLLMQLEAAGFRPRNLQEDVDAATVALTRFARKQELGDGDTMDGATMAVTRMLARTPAAAGSTMIFEDAASAPAAPDPAAALSPPTGGDAPPLDTPPVDEDAEAERAWRALDAKLAEMKLPSGGEPLPVPTETEILAVLAAAKAQGIEIDVPGEEEPTPPIAGEPAAHEAPSPPVDPRQRVIDAHAAGLPIEGDLEGVDLSGLVLVGLRAAGAHLAGANLTGTNLAGATFDDAILFDAKLDGANLAGATLSRADLSRASLAGAVASGATLDEAILVDAVLANANLADATLRAALLRHASLAGVVAHRVVLDDADLTGAMLAGAQLQDASLRDASLYTAFGRGLVLSRAKLENLRAEGANLREADLRESNAKGAVLRGCDLTSAMLSFSTLDGADFTGSVLTHAALGGCSLKSALFVEAKLDQASIVQSNLSHASFVGADLRDADLRGSCLYGAQAWNAKLTGIQLANALIEGSSFAPR